MQSSHQKAMAQYNREVRAVIEAKLHPSPTINGCEILHSHTPRTGEIVFTAWKRNQRVNSMWTTFNRMTVWAAKDFYKEYEAVFLSITAEQLTLELAENETLF